MKTTEIKPGVEYWEKDVLCWTATSEPYLVPDEKDVFYVDIVWSAAQGGGEDYRIFYADEDLHYLRHAPEDSDEETPTKEEDKETDDAH